MSHQANTPMVKYSSIRAIFAIAAALKMHLLQFDIGTAFLNGDLHEDVYMSQPEGFVTPGCERLVCKLRKSLYGFRTIGQTVDRSVSANL